MSSLDQQQNSTTEQYSSITPLSSSGSGTQQAPVEQLSFPDYPAMSDSPLRRRHPLLRTLALILPSRHNRH